MVAAMKRNELVNTVLLHADKTLPRSNVDVVLKGLAKATKAELLRAGQFSLPGVGRFVVVVKKPRMARNPRTGAAIAVPEKRVVGIRPCKELREVVRLDEGVLDQ